MYKLAVPGIAHILLQAAARKPGKKHIQMLKLPFQTHFRPSRYKLSRVVFLGC